MNTAANAWAAVSPCTRSCIADGLPRRGGLVAARRYAGFARTVAVALAAGGHLADPGFLHGQARAVLADLGVTLIADQGPLSVPGAGTGTLVVANHISWVDVVALLAVEPVTLLAKREVGQWPLVGSLVRRAGTRFIDRGGLLGLPAAVAELAGLLRSGRSLIVFPEGTTWCSPPGGVFRRATFQAALDAGAPVRPVTLSYAQQGTASTLPAFVGEGSFADSLHRVASAGDLSVRVRRHAPLWPEGHDRRALAVLAQAAVFGPARRDPAAHTGVRLATEVVEGIAPGRLVAGPP